MRFAMGAASQLPGKGDPLMWMMPLHLHVNQKSDYDNMSYSLDPDQDRHFVVPDLYPNCLQRLSTDDNFRHPWSLTPVKFTLILETYYLSFNNKQDPLDPYRAVYCNFMYYTPP